MKSSFLIFYKVSKSEKFFALQSAEFINSFNKETISPLNEEVFTKVCTKREAFSNPITAEDEALCINSTSLKPEGAFEYKTRGSYLKGFIMNLTFNLEFSGNNAFETFTLFHACAETEFKRLFKEYNMEKFFEINFLNSTTKVAYTELQTCVIENINFKFPLALNEVKNLQKTNILTNYV